MIWDSYDLLSETLRVLCEGCVFLQCMPKVGRPERGKGRCTLKKKNPSPKNP